MKDQIITKKILNWYDLNKRSLPWRKNVSQSKKHYYTLVSEFMLQQTQVVTVIPYFDRFINKIPNLKKLSTIQDNELIKLWEGLGYYSRARNLKKTAKIIISKHHGKIPNNFEDLISLPGIGNYTANAILAIAFNKSYIPLDGNIERVLKRYLYLKKDKDIKFKQLIDITVVDYPEQNLRFKMVYLFLSHEFNHRLILSYFVSENEVINSLTSIFPSANWMEREVFDM